MCGIVGFWQPKSQSENNLELVIENMTAQLQRRGPDSSGIWLDKKTKLALGHRRLSIMDLSSAGHQPMLSHSERWVIIFNGEIYQLTALRQALLEHGLQFRGHSDTECLVEAIAIWGVLDTAKKITGMFAFAAWDREAQELYLARDNMGIKPLYWGIQNHTLFFGSTLKAFRSHPDWHPQLEMTSVLSYLRFNYVPGPLSIFKGIKKLQAGTIVKIDAEFAITEYQFWSLEQVVGQKQAVESEDALLEELDGLLNTAVKSRLTADVPVGAFLSGGIDSSLIAALLQKNSTSPIQTFTIGFAEDAYNEAPYAKKIAQYLGTIHHEYQVTEKDAQAVIPMLPEMYDEPFADSSQIPTFLVSKLAKSSATVVLSGDGGDELFAGYNRYVLFKQLNKIQYIPLSMRKCLSYLIERLSPQQWDHFAKFLPAILQRKQWGEKLHKLSTILPLEALGVYEKLISLWEPADILVNAPLEIWPPAWSTVHNLGLNDIAKTQYIDSLTYLPDDILVKVDRASMHVGLESSVPFLDKQIVEFAWRLPENAKLRNNTGKWILQQVLARHVPKELWTRPKMGFGIPIDAWLRTSLKEWGGDLLSDARLKQKGILRSEPIQKRWQEHSSGKRNWQYSLWGILMFEAWCMQWGIN